MKHKEYNHRSRRKQRNEALCVLGGKCVVCGITDTRMLQIDHIEAAFAIEDRALGRVQHKLYNFVRVMRKAARQRYQVLCANHNWLKRYDRREFRNGHTFTPIEEVFSACEARRVTVAMNATVVESAQGL